MYVHELNSPFSSDMSMAQTSPQHVKKAVEPVTEDFIQFQLLSPSFQKIPSFLNVTLGNTKQTSMLFF